MAKHRLDKGVELLDEVAGRGTRAARGSTVRYCARFFLRRGEEVGFDAAIIERAPEHVTTRVIEGRELVEYTTVIGRRRAIAGVEKALTGMQPGGYREVLVAPRLAYGDTGVAGRIPANAMLRIRLWAIAVSAPA